ncbi:hypothetical protein BGZ63DRAFT_33407 [Mariannaea sp. PMI_226]|nr:hypothetical protein BGZ63DRAFT_33407 [Mariannaea sp. PMI_226]
MRFTIAALLLAASPALARTDLVGCTYYDSVVKDGNTPYATRVWYVPGSGEICEFLDCGGGRAPPKTTVPGCPLYSGTATYSPSYLEAFASKTEGASAATGAATHGSGTSYITAAATFDSSDATITAAATTLSTQVAEAEGSKTATGTPVVSDSTPASGSHSSANPTGTPSATTKASTAGAASMPTAGALMGLMAGAAVYAGML